MKRIVCNQHLIISTIFGWSDPIALFKSRTKITSAGKTDTVRYFLNTHILMR